MDKVEEKKKGTFMSPVFRGSFVTLAKPRAPKTGDGKPKYGINIVLPKDHAFWARLDREIEKCALAKWGKIPKKLKTTRKNGDDEEVAEWAGCYSVPATSIDKPGVVRKAEDGELEEIIDFAEVYSGAWYRCELRCFAYDVEGKGVSVGLQNVMKVRDDKPFSGRRAATEVFANYVDDEDIPSGTSDEDGDDPLAV